MNSLKVSVSGVRGIVGDSLTPTLITDFASAFGEYVGKGRVIIGRDTRPTGLMVEHAVIAGLIAVGCQPVLIDIASTPTVQIMVKEYNARGGIAITASHNPEEWNALKFIGASGIFLSHSESAELLNCYNQPDRNFIIEEDYRKIKKVRNAFNVHTQKIFKHIDTALIKKQKFTVAIDCCNGVGAYHSKKFLEDLGCKVIAIHDETDGKFRRKPEPVPENLTHLSDLMSKNKCDIGFAQDPDGDRIVVLDSSGKAIGEQLSVVLAAEHILSKTPGPVAVNIQTTRSIIDVAEKYNCPLFHTAVGEINVTSKMFEHNAVIGGEGGSGGIIWPQVHPCRDSFSGMAIILEMLASRSKSIEEILEEIPLYKNCSGKVTCSTSDSLSLIRDLKEKYSSEKTNTIDGLRIDWKDSWVLIRASNTEPVIRIFAEALDQEKADGLLKQFTEEISNA